jgi:hypothetical protein
MTGEMRGAMTDRDQQEEQMARITNVAAFVDGWLARELEDWDTRSKAEIRASLEGLREAILPNRVTEEAVSTSELLRLAILRDVNGIVEGK